MYAPWFSSCHNKDLEWQTLKPPSACHSSRAWTDCFIALRSRTDRVVALRQISVTAQCTALFYLDNNRKIHLWGVRACQPKDAKRRAPQHAGERERKSACMRGTERALGSSVYMFFSSPWACPMQIGLGQECCSTWSPHWGPPTFLWPSFVLFSRAFPSLVF